ncbi:MAG: hypothetical protein E7480_07480 [Ruminococcaceae bacterium]|nr:hypothetical protein [Oscillospiraceae bacterium]
MKIRKLIPILILICMLISGCSASVKDFNIREGFAGTYTEKNEKSIEMSFDIENQQLLITDKKSDKIWTNALTDEYYGEEVINKNLIRNKNQLFSVSYVSPENDVVLVRNTDEEMLSDYEITDDKVIGSYEIPDAEISFKVIFEIAGGTLKVTVPKDSISENENLITSIDMLPFFGASVDTEDGYIFFPDGSGTLYEFYERPAVFREPYKANIYGNVFTEYQDKIDNTAAGIKTAMLPVFGVKQGNNAFLAIITSGEAESQITLAPTGYIFKANRVYASYNYRYSYEEETVNEEIAILFEKKPAKSDFSIMYRFLDSDKADYSGMALSYRNYLIEASKLNKSSYSPDVSLDMLVSIKKPMLLWDESVVMSSFKYGKEVIDSLSGTNVKLNLLGWQKQGYNVYPSHFPVSSKAGGDSQLKDLASYAKEHSSTVFLRDNFICADKKQGGYSNKQLAYSVKNEPYTNSDKDKFLFDLRASYYIFKDEFIKDSSKLKIEGIALDELGSFIYQNGSKSSPMRRFEAIGTLDAVFEEAKKNYNVVAVGGGNAYALRYADFIYDLPQSSSRNFLFDKDIPFFHMVVSGYIPYSSEIPGNFSDNYEKTVLQWVEYGYVPYFTISEKNASLLKDCYNEGVFVSTFEDIYEKIKSTAEALKKVKEKTAASSMLHHQYISDTLVEVVYENGVKIYINYSSEKVTYNETEIDAQSFIMK